MLAPTHSVFGIFLTLIILAVFGVQWGLHWTIIIISILGAVIPDIDHPRSFMGRLFPFISFPLERKYGHRGVTHSLVGWTIFSILFSFIIIISISIYSLIIKSVDPLVPRFIEGLSNPLIARWIAAFGISYFSHLILDMFNRRGSQMFWPDTGRDVIPKNPKFRPESGSKAEIPIFFILVALMIFALPISKFGLASSLRWLLATPGSAIEEFKTMKTHTYLEFAGIMAETREPIAGKAELLDVNNKRLVILLKDIGPGTSNIEHRTSDVGQIYTLSDELAADIIASRVRIKKTAIPIKVERKEFNDMGREALLSQIPKGALISGAVHLPEGMTITSDFELRTSDIGHRTSDIEPGTFKTIEQKGNDLILTYASKDQLFKLTAARGFDFQNKKDQVELLSLNARARKIQAQINEINSSNDLTPLGQQLLGKTDDLEKQNSQLAELQSQLEEVMLQIEELKEKINSNKLLFSGEVYIRQ